MKIRVEAGGHPPANNVRVRFLSIGDAEQKADYGAGYKLTFEAIAGPTKGVKCFRTIGQRITPGNAAGAFVAGMYGRPELPLDQELDFDKLVGREYLADIVPSASGKGTRVERVRPAGKPAPQPEPESEIDAADDIPF